MSMKDAREYANSFQTREAIEWALESIASDSTTGWDSMELDMIEAVLESNLTKAPSIYNESELLPATEGIKEGADAWMKFRKISSEAKIAKKEMKAAADSGNYSEAAAKANEVVTDLKLFRSALDDVKGGISFYLLSKLINCLAPVLLLGGMGKAGRIAGDVVGKVGLQTNSKKLWNAGLNIIGTGRDIATVSTVVACIMPFVGVLSCAKDAVALCKMESKAAKEGNPEPTVDDVNRIIRSMKKDVDNMIRDYEKLEMEYKTKIGSELASKAVAESLLFTEEVETALEQIEDNPKYAALESALVQRLTQVFSVDESPQAMQYCWMQPMDFAMEGVVIDARSMKKNTMRMIRQTKSEAKKLARKHQYAEACECLNQCIDQLHKLKKEIADLPDSEKSYILSQVIGLLGNLVISFLVAIGASILGEKGGIMNAAVGAVRSRTGEHEDVFDEDGGDFVSDADSNEDHIKFGEDVGRVNGANAAGRTAMTLGMIAAAAKFGLQSAKMLMTAKKAKQAAADPTTVKMLNENNKLLRAVQSDIDRVIVGLKNTIKRWQQKEADHRSRQEVKQHKADVKASNKEQ